MIDTIFTQPTDTIAIRLSAGLGDFCICTSYFDLLELSILDTLTTISDINPQNYEKVSVYPNPAREHITIERHSDNSTNLRFTLYSMTGRMVDIIESSNSILTCDSRNLPCGLYFYQVVNTSGNEMLEQGKLVIE